MMYMQDRVMIVQLKPNCEKIYNIQIGIPYNNWKYFLDNNFLLEFRLQEVFSNGPIDNYPVLVQVTTLYQMPNKPLPQPIAISQIAKFMGPMWSPPGADRPPDGPHVGPMNLAIRDKKTTIIGCYKEWDLLLTSSGEIWHLEQRILMADATKFLDRVRSWNSGMRCMSFYLRILLSHLLSCTTWWECFLHTPYLYNSTVISSSCAPPLITHPVQGITPLTACTA